MKISYVILHYQNIDITIECIKCLDKGKGEDSNIIIVDNGSPNNTGLEIKEAYQSRKDIFVILNNQNLGFAKGNNIGYLFAKEQIKADIIIVMNNDILINDRKFESKLMELVSSKSADIIAPDIVSKDNVHQNPHRIKKLGNLRIIKRLLLYNIVLVFIKFGWFKEHLIKFVNNYSSKRKASKDFIDYDMGDIVPHGSCIIYTKNYIDKETIAFVPRTFLFSEEDLLYDYIQKKNYKIMYFPEISVLHLEDASINYGRNSSLERFLFNMRNRRNSLFMILINRCFSYKNQ
ncbi:glycosyltransferase family 2 protein [Clostridium sp. D2Q-14]|uniref:glycosyltransferase n=1 Tax=Anaeromonas gelatinilytica TaxID=2683194 RepID=UPI00193BE3FC|nr:glycosyltransferase [Anaeromonas gelatinilytica]MBS4534362.1 glycosyltransferase family 2 protein [Anaeromonas gelatinilytica]